MPSNYNDDGSLEMYIDCLSKLQAFIVDSTAAHTLIAGDLIALINLKIFLILLSLLGIINLLGLI